MCLGCIQEALLSASNLKRSGPLANTHLAACLSCWAGSCIVSPQIPCQSPRSWSNALVTKMTIDGTKDKVLCAVLHRYARAQENALLLSSQHSRQNFCSAVCGAGMVSHVTFGIGLCTKAGGHAQPLLMMRIMCKSLLVVWHAEFCCHVTSDPRRFAGQMRSRACLWAPCGNHTSPGPGSAAAEGQRQRILPPNGSRQELLAQPEPPEGGQGYLPGPVCCS